MAAYIGGLLSEISGLEAPIEELRSLQTAVLAIPLNTLGETVSGLRLQALFSLLNTNDSEQIELCVAILGRILQVLEPVHLAQNFREELQRGLNHPSDSVKTLALDQGGLNLPPVLFYQSNILPSCENRALEPRHKSHITRVRGNPDTDSIQNAT
ncbi:UNVERIFIED_CONTAM: hypothetical protein FKN15_037049 [Acipenser sinensis]